MSNPVQRIAELVIGTVETISSDEIRIVLDPDAPQSMALNTGAPTTFPRLNSYVLIPGEAGATVAYVKYVGVERSPIPSAVRSRDLGLIDLPFPMRKMLVTPVGTLTTRRNRSTNSSEYELARGVVSFPSVGDQCLLPTAEQVQAIVGAKPSDRRVHIGASPLTAEAPIMVDPDKIFGRHLAVLGNTGSGKSCSVAGLIRWSLDAAKKESGQETPPNARFIILDPNGEYSSAFADEADARVFRVPPVPDDVRSLRLPAWMWNGREWAAISSASPGAQRPLLLRALRELRAGEEGVLPPQVVVRRYLRSFKTTILAALARPDETFMGGHGPRRGFGDTLDNIASDCDVFADRLDGDPEATLREIAETVREVANNRRGTNGWFNAFATAEVEAVRDSIQTYLDLVDDQAEPNVITEDAPLPFDVAALPDHIQRIAEDDGNLAAFTTTLGMRLRGMMADGRLGAVIGSEPQITFADWLDDVIGANLAENGPISIIDLSLVPSEIVHIVVAVLGRLTFEALQRYRRSNEDGLPLPTTIVLEEAHNFVTKASGAEGTDASSPSLLCRQTFEKIAREGRKFGLGLVLSSQRPSELSPTILAQCNTFLLHRLVNDMDQALVGRLVPDNVSGLLKELPSLPSRQAILLGWATPLPLLVEMRELPKSQRPLSADPDFWSVWTGKSDRQVSWPEIVDDWTNH